MGRRRGPCLDRAAGRRLLPSRSESSNPRHRPRRAGSRFTHRARARDRATAHGAISRGGGGFRSRGRRRARRSAVAARPRRCAPAAAISRGAGRLLRAPVTDGIGVLEPRRADRASEAVATGLGLPDARRPRRRARRSRRAVVVLERPHRGPAALHRAGRAAARARALRIRAPTRAAARGRARARVRHLRRSRSAAARLRHARAGRRSGARGGSRWPRRRSQRLAAEPYARGDAGRWLAAALALADSACACGAPRRCADRASAAARARCTCAATVFHALAAGSARSGSGASGGRGLCRSRPPFSRKGRGGGHASSCRKTDPIGSASGFPRLTGPRRPSAILARARLWSLSFGMRTRGPLRSLPT